MAERTQPAIGIDLGTTHSVVAHLDASGRPWTIKNAEGDLTTPSVVLFDPASVVVGKEALKVASYEPDRVARFAKRDMGKSAYREPICGEEIPPEVIQALVLRKLREDAALQVGEFRKAVITVPAFFNEPRRKATQDAGRLAGIDVLDIINEPTAAAIAYGVQQGFLDAAGRAAEKETILVYDLGGGTFDATLMTIEGASYKALATVGDVHLGGIDWDRRIAAHLAQEFIEQHGFDPRDDPGSNEQLLSASEDAKRGLTARDHVTIHFECSGCRCRVDLTRDAFEQLTEDLLERTLFTVRNLLRDAKVKWSDITRLLLVGGSTRMPMVQLGLAEESNLTPDRSLAPDEAVAHGAAIYASLVLDSDAEVRPRMFVQNVSSHDLGVLGVEKATGRPRRRVLIPRNTLLPATGKGVFVTNRDNQRTVAVSVVEGGDASGQSSTPIGKCVLSDLPSGLPAKTAIQVLFTYAKNGRLTVQARLPEAKRATTLSIERSSGLPEFVLEQWEERIQAGLRLRDDEEPLEEPELLDDDDNLLEVDELEEAVEILDEEEEIEAEVEEVEEDWAAGDSEDVDSDLDNFLRGH